MNETLRSEILKNINREVVRKPEVRPSLRSPSEISVPARDVLQQFEANLLQLEDLHGRLNFILNEVRLVVRR